MSLIVQYTGTGHVNKNSGAVELVCLTATGEKIGLVIWDTCPDFYLMDCPKGWTSRHIRCYERFLRQILSVKLAKEIVLEKRQQLMGYVVDLANRGLPKKQSLLRLTFRTPADAAAGLKKIRCNQGFNKTVKSFLLEDNSFLFAHRHIKALKAAKVHMQNKRLYPVLWKFQSENHCLPMEWFACPPSTVNAAHYYKGSLRNVREVRHVRFGDLVKQEQMCREKLTATQTVVSWDIETHSDYSEGEDSFPRPHRARSHVINIGVNVSRVIGTADTVTVANTENGTLLLERDVLVLGNTALSTKCRIEPFTNEPAMLLAFLTQYANRADVLIDYNGKSFDWPFVLNRLVLFEWFGQHPNFSREEWWELKMQANRYKGLIKEAASMSASGEMAVETKREQLFNRAIGVLLQCHLVDKKRLRAMRRTFMDMGNNNPRLPTPPEILVVASCYTTPEHFESAQDHFVREYEASQRLPWSSRIHSCLHLAEKRSVCTAMYCLRRLGPVLKKVLRYVSVKVDFGLVQRVGTCGTNFYPSYGWFKNVLTTKTASRSCVERLSSTGLFVLDMCFSDCVRELNLENYSLDTVTQHLQLGGKDDSFHFDYERMFAMWRNGDPYERRSVAEYCIVDVDILLGVFLTLQVMQRNTQTAFASRMALIKTCGGMQGKVWPLLFDAAYREHGMLLNYRPHAKTESYEGAIVLDPRSDLYKPWDAEKRCWTAVATLDFASLYPSVIQKDNICYTTFLEGEEVARAQQCPHLELVGFTDIRDKKKEVYFVQSPSMDDPRTGLLPGLEFTLKKLRDSIRKRQKVLKKERESVLQTQKTAAGAQPDRVIKLTNQINNLEQMQLAIKLIMNSIYGFLGAPGEFAVLPQVHCAAAITQSGRRCIMSTHDMCLAMTADKLVGHLDKGGLGLAAEDEALARRIVGWNPGLQVGCVGGDTDSVFLLFKLRLRCGEEGCGTGALACRSCYERLYHKSMWVFGEVLAAIATYVLFAGKPSMILEMEKFNSIMAVIVKKKYIGLVHKGPTKKGSIGGKGTNVRRGDTIGLVKHVYRHQVCPLLFDPSPEMLDVNMKEKVMTVVHEAYEKLRDGGFPFELFSQRKKLKRPADQYKQSTKKDGTLCALPQHVQVANQIFARTGRPVEVGTYVRWVITRQGDTRKFVDLDHYLSQVQLQQHDPIDVELYMSRLEIVGELLNSFLEPDVFRQMVKLYQKEYLKQIQNPTGQSRPKLLSFLKAGDTLHDQRKRLMRLARTNARKSMRLKDTLKRTKKRKLEDAERVRHNQEIRGSGKDKKAKPASKGILKFFGSK